MVYVQQYRIKQAPRGLRVEAAAWFDSHIEEAAMHITAARVGVQFLAQRHFFLLVPANHGIQIVDDQQLADALVLERRDCGVAQSETADDHCQRLTRDGGQTEISQGDLGVIEHARHQKFIAKFDLVDVSLAECRNAPPAQGDFADG